MGFLVALCAIAGFGRTACAADAANQAVEEVDFGRPCADPQPAFDPRNPADRMTRKSPHSDPATPLTQPPYPEAARMMGMEGGVVVSLLINAEGQVSRARIRRGSRFPSLNAAALEGTRNWKLRPGMEQSKPVCMWGDFSVQFRLQDYPEEDLAKVSVSRDAERLATLLLSAESFDDMMYQEVEFTAQEHALIDAANRAFLANREWLKARHRAAAILSSEFSAAEIAELLKFNESPVAAKMRLLQAKLTPAMTVEAGTSVLAFACATAQLGAALKQEDASKVFAGEQVSHAYAQRVAQYADVATSYCFCRARWESDAARGLSIADGPACGDAPEFESATR
jgi:TonB family protein